MKNYSLIKRIGAGAFGSVHLAKSNEDGTQVVVKERFNFYVTFTELSKLGHSESEFRTFAKFKFIKALARVLDFVKIYFGAL